MYTHMYIYMVFTKKVPKIICKKTTITAKSATFKSH